MRSNCLTLHFVFAKLEKLRPHTVVVRSDLVARPALASVEATHPLFPWIGYSAVRPNEQTTRAAAKRTARLCSICSAGLCAVVRVMNSVSVRRPILDLSTWS